MTKYSELSKEHQNLVLLEIIINQPHSKCDLANTDALDKAKDEIAQNIEAVANHSQFLRNSAKLMGIDSNNPEEYIYQARMDHMLQIAIFNSPKRHLKH